MGKLERFSLGSRFHPWRGFLAVRPSASSLPSPGTPGLSGIMPVTTADLSSPANDLGHAHKAGLPLPVLWCILCVYDTRERTMTKTLIRHGNSLAPVN